MRNARNALGLLTLFAALLTAPGSSAAPVLQVDGSGVLTGALGVEIGGALYDVTFQEGSCAEVFSGCDELADFQFPGGGADAAAQSLLDQVFLGGFDTNPELTLGCAGTTSLCNVHVPFAGEALFAAIAVNAAEESFDVVIPASAIPPGFDTSNVSDAVWAVFAPASQVPEPQTLALLAVAIAALFCMRKRFPLARAAFLTAGRSA